MALINIFIVSDYDWLGGRPHDLLMEAPPNQRPPTKHSSQWTDSISGDDEWGGRFKVAQNASFLLGFPADRRYGITWSSAKRYSMGKYPFDIWAETTRQLQ